MSSAGYVLQATHGRRNGAIALAPSLLFLLSEHESLYWRLAPLRLDDRAFPFSVMFTTAQKRNIVIYTVGIMLYKVGFEHYNGAIITLANERFADDKYQNIGILTGLNSAAQCIGSIIIAPLIKRFPARSVLSVAGLVFGLISAILLVVDASTGGQLRFNTANDKTKYGRWDPDILFPVYIISGVAYGMIELMRRVIPRDIVGGDVQRLRRMDAIVHVLFEAAATAGAFTSKNLIDELGYNNSYLLSPILFGLASVAWRFIDTLGHGEEAPRDAALQEVGCCHDKGGSIIGQMGRAIKAFGKAFYVGMFLVISHRKFVWLITGYSFALYGHRFLENQLAPIFAKEVIGESSYSQIIVGGSNFGELLGALTVALFTNMVPTPIPWLRLDALALQLVWILPYVSVKRGNVVSAWRMAGCFIPISFGWAAHEVSLVAYIQGTLSRMESTDKDVSALGAVMAFLYVTYIVLYAVLTAVLGTWVDDYLEAGHSAHDALKYVGGVQFTVLSVIILVSTCIPVGSLKFNPETIDGMNTNQEDAELATEELSVRRPSIFESPQGKDSREEVSVQQLQRTQ